MNILKEVAVTGKLSPTHARITLQFTFHNPTPYLLSPRYFFPIPEGAAIAGMQLFTKKRTLLRAEIAPLTEMGSADVGFQLTQLDSQLYSLKWESLPAGETRTVLIECILHLLPQSNRCRLILPFGIAAGQNEDTAPCPVTLDLLLEHLEPLRLSPGDFYDPNSQTLSCTAWAGRDLVLDFSVPSPEPCGLLQEEFGKGLGFARICFPQDRLLREPDKTSVLLLLDLSHSTTLRTGNALKELFFRIAEAIPREIPVRFLTTASQALKPLPGEELYHSLQVLPAGVGSLDDLLRIAEEHQEENTLTILVSEGSYAPKELPKSPLVLATLGWARQTALSQHLKTEHLHFYPADSLEQELPPQIKRLLHPIAPPEVIPEGSTAHDCFVLPHGESLSEGYLDIAFSYTGQPPRGFSLWQDGEKQMTCPLLHPVTHSRLPDAEQLFATGKIQRLEQLLSKATPVSGRSIKKELAELQTKYRILGSETILVIPTKESDRSGIPAQFYSAASHGIEPLADRPTIFGEGVRTLPKTQREQLAEGCRSTIYASIRSDGSIHSPLGITPRISAEETALSLLALVADGTTDSSVIQDAFAYLKSAPRTPWSALLKGIPEKEQLQKELLPHLPDFEALLSAITEPLPLTVAAYLLLWISLA